MTWQLICREKRGKTTLRPDSFKGMRCSEMYVGVIMIKILLLSAFVPLLCSLIPSAKQQAKRRALFVFNLLSHHWWGCNRMNRAQTTPFCCLLFHLLLLKMFVQLAELHVATEKSATEKSCHRAIVNFIEKKVTNFWEFLWVSRKLYFKGFKLHETMKLKMNWLESIHM